MSASETRRQVVWSLLGFAFPAAASLFLTPWVIRGLGASRYGLFLLCMTTIGFLSVLELGLAAAAVHELSRARVDEDVPRARAVFSTLLVLFTGLASLGAGVILVGAPLAVERLFKIAPGEQAEALTCVRLAAIGLFFNLGMTPYMSFVRAAERFDLQSKVGIAVTVCATLGTFWRGSQGDLIGALAFNLAGSVATALALAALTYRLDRERTRWARPQVAVVRTLWQFASFQLLSRIAGTVGQEIGKFVLAGTLGTKQLAWFSTPFSLLQKIQRLLGTASAILFPRIARLSGSGDKAAVVTTYRQAQKALIPVALALSLPLGAAAKPFITAWIGPEFAAHAWQPMVIAAVAFGISGAGVGFVQALLGLGRSRAVFALETTHVVINTALLLPLTGALGVSGAALSYLCGWLALAVGQVAIRAELGPEASRGIGRVVLCTAVVALPVGAGIHVLAPHLVFLGVLGPLALCGVGTLVILGGLALWPGVFGEDVAVAEELRGAPGRVLGRVRRMLGRA